MFRVSVDGEERWARPGQTVAAVLLAAGRTSWRSTRGGRPRGLFCGIGVCHDCLVTVNDLPNVRACRREASDGDRIRTQEGAGPALGVADGVGREVGGDLPVGAAERDGDRIPTQQGAELPSVAPDMARGGPVAGEADAQGGGAAGAGREERR